MRRRMDSASWSWKEFKDYYFPGGKRVLLTRRDRSIQQTVDLLEAMEEESNSGDPSSPSTSDRILKLPSASSDTKARGIRKRITPHLRRRAYFSSSEAPGIIWSPDQSPEAPTAPDRFINLKPTFDPQLGSSEAQDGDSGLPGTEDSAGDSDGA